MVEETLKKSLVFSSLSDEELKAISPLFEHVTFKNDNHIFMEGDPPDWLYISSQGRAKIVKHTAEGKDVILEVKSPGEIFCCATVLDKDPYPESAQAMEDMSAIRIRRKNLVKVIDDYPVLKVGFAKYFSDRLRDAHEMLKEIATERVERRIVSVLLKLSEKSAPDNDGFSVIDFSLTRQEIAEMVGTTVETCIRTMSKIQKQGMVKSTENRIYVHRDMLQAFLDE